MRVALLGLSSNKLRSALTMLGITIGVSAVIVLVSLGQAVDGYVRDQFLSIGTNLLIVFASENDQGVTRRLTEAEAVALADPFNVPDASLVMPQRQTNRSASYEGREIEVRIQGVTTAYPEIRNRSVLAGAFFDTSDYQSASRVVVLGLDTVKRLFPVGINPIGQNLRIEDVTFRIIGVLSRVGGGGLGANDDDIIIMPLSTLQSRLIGDRDLSGQRPVGSILVQARDSDGVQAVVEQIRDTMRSTRGINFRDEDDFQIFAQGDLLESLGNVTGLLTVFVSMIAGISLLVGGIGIMNIMLVTVTERTREIGLRKAVGAQKGDILFQILVESITLALIGGGVGVLIATGVLLLVGSLLPELQAVVEPSSVVLASVISVTVGVFFGIYPANRAASLNPIDALRYE